MAGGAAGGAGAQGKKRKRGGEKSGDKASEFISRGWFKHTLIGD
jgi:hypothetical protein